MRLHLKYLDNEHYLLSYQQNPFAAVSSKILIFRKSNGSTSRSDWGQKGGALLDPEGPERGAVAMKEIGTLAEIESWGQRIREEEIGRGKKEEGVTGWVSQAGPMWKSVQMSIKVRLQIIKDLIRLLDIVQLMKCKLLEVQIFFLSQACLLLAAKVWSFVAYLFKKQYRTVSFPPPMSCSWHSK